MQRVMMSSDHRPVCALFQINLVDCLCPKHLVSSASAADDDDHDSRLRGGKTRDDADERGGGRRTYGAHEILRVSVESSSSSPPSRRPSDATSAGLRLISSLKPEVQTQFGMHIVRLSVKQKPAQKAIAALFPALAVAASDSSASNTGGDAGRIKSPGSPLLSPRSVSVSQQQQKQQPQQQQGVRLTDGACFVAMRCAVFDEKVVRSKTRPFVDAISFTRDDFSHTALYATDGGLAQLMRQYVSVALYGKRLHVGDRALPSDDVYMGNAVLWLGLAQYCAPKDTNNSAASDARAPADNNGADQRGLVVYDVPFEAPFMRHGIQRGTIQGSFELSVRSCPNT